MKIGDYVRTKYGEICQLKEPKYNGLIYSTDIEIDRYNDRDCNDYGFDNDTIKDIIKSSPNIIDLIEEGDYVNGCKIIDICIDEMTNLKYLETDITEFDNIYACGHINIYEKDIRTVVTKQQFESMEYKI